MQVFLLAAYPILENVLQLERFVAECGCRLFRVRPVEVENLLLHVGMNLYVFVRPGAVVKARPGNRHRRRVVCRAAHLVDIPVCLQVAKVADPCVCPHTLYLLVVPQGECVIVSVGEYDRISFVLHRHEVVLSEVAACVSSAAVMVVPCLTRHLYGHDQAQQRHNGCHGSAAELVFLKNVDDCRHSDSAPYSERIERACVSIVAFTRLHRCLVKIEDNSKSGHEEQEEHHPELPYAPLASVSLPEKAYESEQQRHAIEHVVSFVGFQFVRKLALVAEPPVVEERYTGNPVAVFQLSVALYVVLPSCEVPHEVTPIHEVTLVRKEEADVFCLCRNLNRYGFSAPVVRYVRAVDASHPALV